MKIEWEAKDIQPGVIVGRPQRGERWMIGYMPAVSSDSARYALVSTSDGMVSGPHTAEALAARLNQSAELIAEVLDHPRLHDALRDIR